LTSTLRYYPQRLEHPQFNLDRERLLESVGNKRSIRRFHKQSIMQLTGFVKQRLYLFSKYWGIDCSGIGAFYNDKTQAFLETNKHVLHAMATGK